jgi:ABC-type Fe3+/spermidine/putrescine transport system ATPase subunit
MLITANITTPQNVEDVFAGASGCGKTTLAR